MLTVSGIAAVFSVPDIRDAIGGKFFNFVIIVPDKNRVRHKHRIGVFVPEKDLEQAKKELIIGQVFLLKYGQWSAIPRMLENEKESISNNIKTAWNNIEILEWFGSGRKKDG